MTDSCILQKQQKKQMLVACQKDGACWTVPLFFLA